MNQIVFLDPNPDWIQFATAHSLATANAPAQIQMLDQANLAGVVAGDTVYLIGHGSPMQAGVWTSSRKLARRLEQRGLPKTATAIRLASCSTSGDTGHSHLASFAYNLKQDLRVRGYADLKVAGPTGPLIAGWNLGERVVTPGQEGAAGLVQQNSVIVGQAGINLANVHIGANLAGNVANPVGLAAMALYVANQTNAFWVDFAANMGPNILGPGAGWMTH
jgi:hypothetical protein